MHTGRELGQRVGAATVERQLHLLRGVGVPDRRGHGEPIELALDEREGAALRLRVLRRDDEVGLRATARTGRRR